MRSRDCIVVMARRPAPGEVKTRLAAALGDDNACRLYEAFLLDTLDACRQVDARLMISYAPGEEQARRYFSAVAPAASLIPQQAVPFGERLARAMSAAFDQGHGRVAVIGSDIPHIRPDWIAGAFEALDSHDAAIGPTRDGGYFLLALRRPEPRLLERIDWSSGRELAQTIARTLQLGLRTAAIQESFDIDTVADLHELRSLIEERGPSLCPRTAIEVQRIVQDMRPYAEART